MNKEFEGLLGNSNCYDTCQLGHQCFGGYINENIECEKETDRILRVLRECYPDAQLLPSPEGLLFYFNKYANQLILTQGEIQRVNQE
jgi:hypothetical protein